MRKTKKVLALLLVLAIMIGSLTFVNAAETLADATISEGVRNGNKITFDINLPANTGLRGDANEDGVVDATDSVNIQNHANQTASLTGQGLINADFNIDGVVDVSDFIGLNMALLGTDYVTSQISLEGTLASNSTAKLVKDSNGNYKVEVTIPEGTTEGTITVKLAKDLFISQYSTVSRELSSPQFAITTNTGDNTPGTDGGNTDSGNTNNGNTNNGNTDSGNTNDGNTNSGNTNTDSDNNGSNNSGTTDTEEAKTFKVTIKEPKKEDKKIIFALELPEGSGLKGDVNQDGVVDSVDGIELQNHVAQVTTLKGQGLINADFNADGVVDVADVVAINMAVLTGQVSVDGTLASKATAKLVRNQDGSYSIEVTLAEDAEEGTIEVTLAKDVFINAEKEVNEETTSKSFKVSKDNTITEDESNKDEQDNKTEEDKKEEDKKDDAADKKDDTTANTKIPQTGVRNTILVVIAGVAIAGIVLFIRSRKMLK